MLKLVSQATATAHTMDWNLVIERNSLALRRIVTSVFALAGFTGDAAPSTLPRHLHRAALKVLRPAESALRRLIIVAARDVKITLSPSERERIARAALVVPTPPSRTGVFLRGRLAGPEELNCVSRPRTVDGKPHAPSFGLFDPLKRFGAARQGPSQWVPRIVFNLDGGAAPVLPARSPASPDDPVGAGRLYRRLEALNSALDDLPGQARRLARWRARRRLRQGSFGRLSPLRPGSPPGHRRNGLHPVDDLLHRCYGLALDTIARRDTS